MTPAELEACPDVTPNEAARLARVTRRTIYRWVELGLVTYRRTAGGKVRIITETLWRQPDTKGSPREPIDPHDAMLAAVSDPGRCK